MTAVVLPFRTRESRRPIVRDLCAISEHLEGMSLVNLRIAFAWQRVLIRTWWGV